MDLNQSRPTPERVSTRQLEGLFENPFHRRWYHRTVPQYSPIFFLSLMAGLLFCTVAWLSPASCLAAGRSPEAISVSIQASAQWDDITRNENGDELRRDCGSYLIMIRGTMSLDPSGSPVINRQGIMGMPVETYLPDRLVASYSYQEEAVDLRPREYRSCDNPLLHRYEGSHSAPITDGPRLLICNYASMAAPFMKNLSGSEKQFAAQLQAQLQKAATPNFYQFAVGGGTASETAQKVTVAGIRLTGPPDCEFEDVEKATPVLASACR